MSWWILSLHRTASLTTTFRNIKLVLYFSKCLSYTRYHLSFLIITTNTPAVWLTLHTSCRHTFVWLNVLLFAANLCLFCWPDSHWQRQHTPAIPVQIICTLSPCRRGADTTCWSSHVQCVGRRPQRRHAGVISIKAGIQQFPLCCEHLCKERQTIITCYACYLSV